MFQDVTDWLGVTGEHDDNRDASPANSPRSLDMASLSHGRNNPRTTFPYGSSQQGAPLPSPRRLKNHFTTEHAVSNQKPTMKGQESMLSGARHTNTVAQHNVDRRNDSEYAQFLTERLASLRAARTQVEQMVMMERHGDNDGTAPINAQICPCGQDGPHEGHWHEGDVPPKSPVPSLPMISFDGAARHYWANRYLTDQLIQRDYTYVENECSPRDELAASFRPNGTAHTAAHTADLEPNSHSARRLAAQTHFTRAENSSGSAAGSTKTKLSSPSGITGTRTLRDKIPPGDTNNNSALRSIQPDLRSRPSSTGSARTTTTQPALLRRTTTLHNALQRSISPTISKVVSWDELPQDVSRTHRTHGANPRSSLIRDDASWVPATMPSLSPITSVLNSPQRPDEGRTLGEKEGTYRDIEEIRNDDGPIYRPPQLVPQCAPPRLPHRPRSMRDVDNIRVAQHMLPRGASCPTMLRGTSLVALPRGAPTSTRVATTPGRWPSAPPAFTAKEWRTETAATRHPVDSHYASEGWGEALPSRAERKGLRAGAATDIYDGNMPMPTCAGVYCARALVTPPRAHIQSAVPSLTDIHAAPPQVPNLQCASPSIHMQAVRKQCPRSASSAPVEIHHYDSSVPTDIRHRSSSLPAEVRHFASSVSNHVHHPNSACSDVHVARRSPMPCRTCAGTTPTDSYVMSSAAMHGQTCSGAPPTDLHVMPRTPMPCRTCTGAPPDSYVMSSAAMPGQTYSGAHPSEIHVMPATPMPCQTCTGALPADAYVMSSAAMPAQTYAGAPPTDTYVMSSAAMPAQTYTGAPPTDSYALSSTAMPGQTYAGAPPTDSYVMSSAAMHGQTYAGAPPTDSYVISSAAMPGQNVHVHTNKVPETDVVYVVSPPDDNDVVPHVITHSSNLRSTIHRTPTLPGAATMHQYHHRHSSARTRCPNAAQPALVSLQPRHQPRFNSRSLSTCRFAPLSSQSPPALRGPRSSHTCCPPTIRAFIVHLRTVPISPAQLRQLRHEVAVAIEWSVRREHRGVQVTCVDFRSDGIGMRGVYVITPAICRNAWDAIMADESTPIHCLLDLLEPIRALAHVPVRRE